LFLTIFFPNLLLSEVVWLGSNNSGFSASVDQSLAIIGVDRKLQIALTVSSPDGFQVDKDKVRNNLLSYNGFRPTPFVLLNEEVIIQSDNTHRIIFTLDPEYPGDYLLTFGMIEFYSEDESVSDTVKLFSGVFSIKVTASTTDIAYDGMIAPLMPLSVALPVDINGENREKYVDNVDLLMEELEKHRKLFPKRGESTIVFAILILVKLAIAFLAFWKVTSKSKVSIPKNILHQKALQKAISGLDKLKTSDIPQDEKYYVGLTNVVRQFIEEAFELNAPSLTTPEFLDSVSDHPKFDTEKQQIIQKFLIEADKVKFALNTPSDDDCTKAHLSAKTIVEKLIPEELELYSTQGITFMGTKLLLKNFFKRWR